MILDKDPTNQLFLAARLKNNVKIKIILKHQQHLLSTFELNLQSQSTHCVYFESVEWRCLGNRRELVNIHHCGFVSSFLGFVGGMLRKPTAVKGFLWCGRNWFDLVQRATQMLLLWSLSVVLMNVVVYKGPDHHILLICKSCCFSSFSSWMDVVNNGTDTHYPQYATYHLNFLLTPNQTRPLSASSTPHSPSSVTCEWRAVTHIPAVTVNRTGATLADGPWTL